MSAPYCRALLLADNVLCDQFTDKWSLIGVFSTAWAHRFPILVPTLACYASVFDAGDAARGAKFVIRDPEQAVIREHVFNDIDLNPAGENEFGCIFPNVLLDKAGRYSVEFVMDGQLLQSARLDAKLVPHFSVS